MCVCVWNSQASKPVKKHLNNALQHYPTKKRMTMSMTLRTDSCIPNLSKNSSCSVHFSFVQGFWYRHSPVDLLKRPEFQKADLARSPWRCPCHVSNSAIELPNVAHPPENLEGLDVYIYIGLKLHHVTRFFGMIYGIFRKRMYSKRYKNEPRCWKIEIQVFIGFYRHPSGNFQSSSRKRTSDAKPSAAASARKRKPSKTAWRLCACVRMWAWV